MRKNIDLSPFVNFQKTQAEELQAIMHVWEVLPIWVSMHGESLYLDTDHLCELILGVEQSEEALKQLADLVKKGLAKEVYDMQTLEGDELYDRFNDLLIKYDRMDDWVAEYCPVILSTFMRGLGIEKSPYLDKVYMNRTRKHENGWLFTKDDTWLVSYGEWKGNEGVVPEGVTCIASLAFQDASCLKKVQGNKGLEIIGAGAFLYCDYLKQVVLLEGLKVLGDGVFEGCSRLKQVVLPDGLKVMGNGVFKGCKSLREVRIPEGVRVIGKSVFEGCGALVKVYLPKTLEYISEDALAYCSALQEIVVAEDNPYFESVQGALYTRGRKVLLRAVNAAVTALPAELEVVKEMAFAGLSMNRLVLPSSVKVIKSGAFSFCNSLVSVEMGDEVTSLGAWAFAGCPKLSQVRLSENLTELGHSAFLMCSSLKDITLPDSLLTMGDGVFQDCNRLRSIEIPNGVERIPVKAFNECTSLEDVLLPEDLLQIDEEAFAGCTSLTDLYLVEEMTEIGAYAFERCTSLKQVYFPHSVVGHMHETAFASCKVFEKYSLEDVNDKEAVCQFIERTRLLLPKANEEKLLAFFEENVATPSKKDLEKDWAEMEAMMKMISTEGKRKIKQLFIDHAV